MSDPRPSERKESNQRSPFTSTRADLKPLGLRNWDWSLLSPPPQPTTPAPPAAATPAPVPTPAQTLECLSGSTSDSDYGNARPPPASVLDVPVTADPPTPPEWTESLAEANTQLEMPFIKIPVGEISDEYKEISKLFGFAWTSGASMTGQHQIHRIINPELWRRFVRARSDLLSSKSEDLKLLSGLGLSDQEIAQKTHAILNFDKTHLNGSPYCDNMVLLLHGSKGGAEAVDKILSQGLDERLAVGGLFGRGIYFADDPEKAMQYDRSGVLIVFAVMLGDCLDVTKDPADYRNLCPRIGSAVREPVKEATQWRNHFDLFFDSIVGRGPMPYSMDGQANEYVIFNRALCYPLYTITYPKSDARWLIPTTHAQAAIAEARLQIPSFAWTSSTETDINTRFNRLQLNNFDVNGRRSSDPRTPPGKSPFYASTVFQAMAPVWYDCADRTPSTSAAALMDPSITSIWVTSDHAEFGERGYRLAVDDYDDEGSQRLHKRSLDDQLSQLEDLGFMDRVGNENLLRCLNFDMHWTVEYLMKKADAETAATDETTTKMTEIDALTFAVAFEDMDLNQNLTRSSTALPNPTVSASRPPPQPLPLRPLRPATAQAQQREACLICTVEYPRETTNHAGATGLGGSGHGHWETLPCSHKLCTSCAGRIRTTSTTMTGRSHTFLKCPFCQSTSGIQVGHCPNGAMTVTKLPNALPGYNCGSISIRYSVQGGGHTLDQTAYLPDNPEGQAVLKLLRIAWNRRLIFKVGTSTTTGAENVLVWNISHKTSQKRGATLGYPDPTYLQRVRNELAQYGIQ